eukprot:5582838-Pyramimonas_sp.AAC.1
MRSLRSTRRRRWRRTRRRRRRRTSLSLTRPPARRCAKEAGRSERVTECDRIVCSSTTRIGCKAWPGRERNPDDAVRKRKHGLIHVAFLGCCSWCPTWTR